jgi:hypothetical protein
MYSYLVSIKNKIFLWFFKKEVILTKDNLRKKKGIQMGLAVFVANLKPFNIFPLSASTQNFCGEQYNGARN